ncbi:MAG: hypothetical protein A3K03_07865 [Bdellovibrionales bacterium RIFOXYD1_FULL_44_7]|nr:MAG: hypothetical protein A3K03_07865 [Bdellovibrionales bacterium RIFOXYD1_FULL_44_7]
MPFEAYKLYQEYEPDKYKTSTQKKAEGVLKEADEMKRAQGKETISGIEFQEAKELLGEDLIGPEEVEKTWGVRPEDVPEIPFSREELERAKEMGQMLVLRVEKTEDGKPMSMEAMIDIIQKRWDKEGKGKLLYTDNEYKNWKERTGADFGQKAPRAGWTLVSRELLPQSTSKNYAQQTELMVAYLKDTVFKDMEIPEEYEEAFQEWEQVKQTDKNIQELLRNPDNPKYDWQQAAEELAELKITQLTRQSIQETIYDLALYYDKNGKRLLPNVYTWSNPRSTDGYLVYLGYFGARGVNGNRCTPDYRRGHLGVLLSRRL